MSEALEKALLAIIPSVITFILGFMVNKYHKLKEEVKDKQAEKDAIRLAVKYMLKKSLMEDYEYFTAQGYLPMEDRRAINECWQLYNGAFEGNGQGEFCYKKLMELPDKKLNKNSEVDI